MHDNTRSAADPTPGSDPTMKIRSPHPHETRRLPARMRPTTAEIDTRLIPLISALWRLGYTTKFCCQGDAGGEDWDDQAYIMFATPLEAVVFAALAGPLAWDRRAHRQRHGERPTATERWCWDWHIDACCVHFPARDIDRATVAVRRLPRFAALIGAVSATPIPHRPAPPTCPRCLMDLIGAVAVPPDALRPAPRTCPTCGGVVVSRRKDARYCSRRCQLAARDRRGKG